MLTKNKILGYILFIGSWELMTYTICNYFFEILITKQDSTSRCQGQTIKKLLAFLT